MEEHKKLIETASLLAGRLERLSADSIWAHRSSGLRGSLLKFLENFQSNDTLRNDLSAQEISHLQELMKRAFYILENAAREIPEKR